MAYLQKHFTLALVVFALTTGFWNKGEGQGEITCKTDIQFASCEKDRPSTCVNICRSGLYFPAYRLIQSVCEGRLEYGHFGYYCSCLWECGDVPPSAAANASPPISVSHPPVSQ